MSATDGAYSRADRLLHRLALGSRAVIETSFDLERAVFGRAAEAVDVRRPIFVCGLARSGTSLVTRLIASVPGLATPAYRDMPFPLAPNLWARLGGKKRRVAPAQRGHGDGLDHDLDTPEAIEEVFWRCFEGPHYRCSDGLAPTPPSPETMAMFRRYTALVALRCGGGRYLSKNNNNVLRVRALAEALPDALFVHPFRHPVAQAASLRRQHERARELQRRDRFRLRYAQWLGHHEFGLDQRPFLLPGAPSAEDDQASPCYWLACWQSVYGHLLDQSDGVSERQFFLDYDALCRKPKTVLATLARFLDIGCLERTDVRSARDREDEAPVPAGIAKTYCRLRERQASPAFERPLGMSA